MERRHLKNRLYVGVALLKVITGVGDLWKEISQVWFRKHWDAEVIQAPFDHSNEKAESSAEGVYWENAFLHQLQEVCQTRPLPTVEIEEHQEDHLEHNCLVTEAFVYDMIQTEHVFQAVLRGVYFLKQMWGHHSAVVPGDDIQKELFVHFVWGHHPAVVPGDDIQDGQSVHSLQGPHCDAVVPGNDILDEYLLHFVRDESLVLVVDADPSSWMAH